MNQVVIYFLIFVIVSFAGWVNEVVITLFQQKKFVNRGFLIGPYCPVYGAGALLITVFLSKYQDDIIALFVMSVVMASVLEYLTSYILEKLFKFRWWDYSHIKFNINGRVCLINSILFGIAGILLIYIFYPFFIFLLNISPIWFNNLIALLLATILLIDVITSFSIIGKLKLTVNLVAKDYTTEITEKVKEIINNNSVFVKRIFDAFPNYHFIINKIKKRNK